MFAWIPTLAWAIALLVGTCHAQVGPTASLPWRVGTGGTLVDSDGRAVLINGEAVWSMAVALRREEAEYYLDRRSRLGINAIMVEAIEHHFSGGPRNAMGDLPFVDTPFGTPNEPYFRHLDWLIDAAAQRGMVVFLAPAYLGFQCGDEGWCAEIRRTSPAQMQAYGRFLGRRYRQRTNIVWLHGGDADARAFGVLRQVEALAQALRAEAPSHLHTAQCHRNTLASQCYPWPWLQIDAVYADCDTIGWVTSWARGRSRRPFLMIEGRYEGQGADSRCLRRQFLVSALGGGMGQMFGTHRVRVFLPGWAEHLDSPGARDLSWLGARLRERGSLPWLTLHGRRGLVVSVDPDERANQPPVAAAAGGRLLVYVPEPRTLRIAAPPAARWCGTWTDLATRADTTARIEPAGKRWLATRPPGTEDSLLELGPCHGSVVGESRPQTSK